MTQKSYKVPAILGAAFYFLAVIVGVAVTGIFYIVNASNGGYLKSGNMGIPSSLLGYITHFILYVIYMLIILFYKGEKRRLIEIIMFVVMGIVALIQSFSSFVLMRILLQTMGSMAYAASSSLNSTMTLFTSFFTALANLFMIIGIARFGVSHPEEEEEIVEE